MTGVRRPLPPGVALRRPVLADLHAAGLVGSAELHLALTFDRLVPGVDDDVLVTLALATRAVAEGHVRVALDGSVPVGGVDGVAEGPSPWPPAGRWRAALSASPLVATPATARRAPLRPLVLDGDAVYLQRLWCHEDVVAADVAARAARAAAADVDEAVATDVLDRLFDPDDPDDPAGPDRQRQAVRTALAPGISLVAGGPGTGKTYTVARLVAAAVLARPAGTPPPRVALTAPTGKAAARLQDSVEVALEELVAAGRIDRSVLEVAVGSGATTVHRLLGAYDTRVRHDREHPLVHDLVVVDETSMVSLPLMARLLAAVRPEASVVLVGDPFQLASVEAGTVLADLVGPAATGRPGNGPLADRVTVLRRMRRYDAGSPIAVLADAVRRGDADGAVELLASATETVRWVRPGDADRRSDLEDEVTAAAVELATAGRAGDRAAAVDAATRVKVLTATRQGPGGLAEWSGRIEQAVTAALPDLRAGRRWFAGRPVLVTANDPVNRVSNGDTGVVLATPAGLRVALGAAEDRLLPVARLAAVETWWAMTIHKSQGSEFDHAVVSLPPVGSPLLTRELLYTGVTRGRETLTVVGDEAAVREAVARPVQRASGLGDRLWRTPQ